VVSPGDGRKPSFYTITDVRAGNGKVRDGIFTPRGDTSEVLIRRYLIARPLRFECGPGRPLAACSRLRPANRCLLMVVCRDHLGDVEVVRSGPCGTTVCPAQRNGLCHPDIPRTHVRFERHQVGDAADPRMAVRIRPCRLTCVTDGVIAAGPLYGQKVWSSREWGGLIEMSGGVERTRARRESRTPPHSREAPDLLPVQGLCSYYTIGDARQAAWVVS